MAGQLPSVAQLINSVVSLIERAEPIGSLTQIQEKAPSAPAGGKGVFWCAYEPKGFCTLDVVCQRGIPRNRRSVSTTGLQFNIASQRRQRSKEEENSCLLIELDGFSSPQANGPYS